MLSLVYTKRVRYGKQRTNHDLPDCRWTDFRGVQLENNIVWPTQVQLFERERTVITKHINHVFKEGELDEKSNVHFLYIANSDKPVKFYSLDVIISIGYRVKSQRGTQFRIWANRVLRDYLIKGYALSDRVGKENYNELRRLLQLTGRTLHNREISNFGKVIVSGWV